MPRPGCARPVATGSVSHVSKHIRASGHVRSPWKETNALPSHKHPVTLTLTTQVGSHAARHLAVSALKGEGPEARDGAAWDSEEKEG
jgi:hypothetical protein